MVKQIRIPTGNALWDHTFEKIRKDGVRHAQNMRDKAKKGRARGSRHPNVKYDEQTVLKIKKALTSKAQYEVADEFGIPRSTIAAIATGRLWGHVVLRGGE